MLALPFRLVRNKLFNSHELLYGSLRQFDLFQNSLPHAILDGVLVLVESRLSSIGVDEAFNTHR